MVIGLKEEFEERLEFVNDLVKENYLTIALLIIAGILLVIFWQRLYLILQTLLYAAVALAAIIAAILVLVKVKYRQPSLKALNSEKKRLLTSINIAERKYMHRKISEKDFNSFFKEKQRKLIQLEAKIDQLYNKEKKVKVDKEVLAVQTKKRHILKSLLEEKRRIIKELDIAEKRYLKRKIDAKTYQEMVQRDQHSLIELEAQIKELYKEANVTKVMENLKEKLSEIEKKKRKKRVKRARSEKEEFLRIAKEIAEQVSEK